MRHLLLALALAGCAGKSGTDTGTPPTSGTAPGTLPGSPGGTTSGMGTGAPTGTSTAEICDNGLDDDADGLIDCEDDDCLTDPACFEGDCTNGADDDADGLVDCADEDCWTDPACTATDALLFLTAGSIERELTRNGVVSPGGQCSVSSSFNRTEIWSPTGLLVTPAATCSWSGSATHVYGSTVYRSGFWVQSGCGPTSSSTAFLPVPLGAQFGPSYASVEIRDGNADLIWAAPYSRFLSGSSVPATSGQPCFLSSEWVFSPVSGAVITLP